MNNDQLIHYNEYARLEEHFNLNAALLNTFFPLKEKIALFMAEFTEMRKHVSAKTAAGGGAKKEKDAAKLAMATAASDAGVIASDYFHGLNDETNATILERSISYLNGLPDGDSLGACKKMRDILNGKVNLPVGAPVNLLVKYEITAATITDIDAKMATFQSKNPTPVTAGLGNDQSVNAIDTSIGKIETALESTDRLIIHFKSTNLTMVEDYFKRRKQIAVGIRHTGIKATIVDANNKVITNGLMSVGIIGKTVALDISGIAFIKSMRSGIYPVTFSAPGYVDQIITLTVKRGSTLEITVNLVKVGVNQN